MPRKRGQRHVLTLRVTPLLFADLFLDYSTEAVFHQAFPAPNGFRQP